MKKRTLSLALALVLTLALAVPAAAAGTKKVVYDERVGYAITLDGYLRTETHWYPHAFREDPDGDVKMTVHVVADGSTVTVEAMEGLKYFVESEYDAEELRERYAECCEDGEHIFDWESHAGGVYYEWDEKLQCINEEVLGARGLATGPYTFTINEDDSRFCNPECFIVSESYFAKFEALGKEKSILAADWAQDALEKAYDADLFPYSVNPYEEDCSRGMTRKEFAAVAVKLYAAMQGKPAWNLEVSSEEPFTDVEYDYDIGRAYNLGFVNGTSATTFTPDGTLSREQAAVMLSRVYSKLHGDIPAVAATTFGDDASIGDWAKAGVAFMAENGVVGGVGGNTFAPQNTLSIQEAVVMAQRMLENLK